MGLLLGLDIGTSTVKALLLDSDRGVLGSVTADYPLYAPHPGWSEQEPEDMLKDSTNYQCFRSLVRSGFIDIK